MKAFCLDLIRLLFFLFLVILLIVLTKQQLLLVHLFNLWQHIPILIFIGARILLQCLNEASLFKCDDPVEHGGAQDQVEQGEDRLDYDHHLVELVTDVVLEHWIEEVVSERVQHADEN